MGTINNVDISKLDPAALVEDIIWDRASLSVTLDAVERRLARQQRDLELDAARRREAAVADFRRQIASWLSDNVVEELKLSYKVDNDYPSEYAVQGTFTLPDLTGGVTWGLRLVDYSDDSPDTPRLQIVTIRPEYTYDHDEDTEADALMPWVCELLSRKELPGKFFAILMLANQELDRRIVEREQQREQAKALREKRLAKPIRSLSELLLEGRAVFVEPMIGGGHAVYGRVVSYDYESGMLTVTYRNRETDDQLFSVFPLQHVHLRPVSEESAKTLRSLRDL